MSILGDLERLINEHGSATILRERLALAKDEHASLEKKATTLEQENATLRAETQRLQLDNYEFKEKIGNLEKQLAEIHGAALSKEEEQIVGLLAKSGRSMTLQQIADSIGSHQTRAKHFLNKLYEAGYIGISGSYTTGQVDYHLYAKGQEYAVKHGFV